MAFGGALTSTVIGPAAGPNAVILAGNTLAANVGAFAIGAADSGRYTTDQTPPANETAIPGAFGPGEGAWTQADVDAVMVTIDNAVVAANTRLGLAAKSLVAGNLNIDIHSLEVGIPGASTVTLQLLHTLVRGR